jgi:hypothetical protein
LLNRNEFDERAKNKTQNIKQLLQSANQDQQASSQQQSFRSIKNPATQSNNPKLMTSSNITSSVKLQANLLQSQSTQQSRKNLRGKSDGSTSGQQHASAGQPFLKTTMQTPSNSKLNSN